MGALAGTVCKRVSLAIYVKTRSETPEAGHRRTPRGSEKYNSDILSIRYTRSNLTDP
jgi:hypothetical protein